MWGLRSLVLPLTQIGFGILIIGLGIQLWRMALQAVAPLRRGYDRILDRASRLIGWARSFRIGTVAAGHFLVVQAVTLRLVWWRFGDVFESFNSFVLRSGSLAMLSPGDADADERQWFTRVFSLLVLAFGWSWYRLLRSETTHAGTDRRNHLSSRMRPFDPNVFFLWSHLTACSFTARLSVCLTNRSHVIWLARKGMRQDSFVHSRPHHGTGLFSLFWGLNWNEAGRQKAFFRN